MSFTNLFGAYANAQSASLADAYVSKRASQGWLTTNVSPPTPTATAPGGAGVQYEFSEELNQWLVDLVQPLVEGATPGIYNLFLSGEGGGYRWINNATPASVPPAGCPGSILVLCFQFVDVTAPAGASADFRHVLFESTASLVPGAPEGRQNLYESVEEDGAWHVKMAGVLPDGKIAEESTAGSGSNSNGVTNHVANAISQGGERVVFQALSDEGQQPAESGQAGMMEVYERLNGTETVELSKPAPGATPANTAAQPAMFWGASTDGKHVFFTSQAELTTQSYTGAPVCNPEEEVFTGCSDRGDLYEYDLETETLKDLTVDTNLPADTEEGASVQGVVGTSADGAYVYFVAKGQLVPGKGVDGGYNLYVVHDGGAPAFIATLNEADANDWAEREVRLESYLTPSGRHLAFTSVNPLASTNFPSGYDNVNEGTGSAEREVYEYAAATESVVCVSCDPSGAPPIGAGLLGSVGRGEGNGGRGASSAFHQARVVSSNGGRVFFTSRDPLVPSLKGNTAAKLYEYEQEGEGTCETKGGCVYLLSSPSSPDIAYFVDADSTGDNVFLATLGQLTPSDADQLYDVYDSRVDGGLQSPATAVPCSGSCRTAGEPLSTTSPLSGASGASGNLRAATRPTETRADKLAKALKACRKKKSRRKRRSCRAQARKRYGAQPRAHRSAWSGKRRG